MSVGPLSFRLSFPPPPRAHRYMGARCTHRLSPRHKPDQTAVLPSHKMVLSSRCPHSKAELCQYRSTGKPVHQCTSTPVYQHIRTGHILLAGIPSSILAAPPDTGFCTHLFGQQAQGNSKIHRGSPNRTYKTNDLPPLPSSVPLKLPRPCCSPLHTVPASSFSGPSPSTSCSPRTPVCP